MRIYIYIYSFNLKNDSFINKTKIDNKSMIKRLLMIYEHD